MKAKILLLLLLAGNYLVSGQSVAPVLLASCTGGASLQDASIFWSSGELTITTMTGATNQITQGFWQPEMTLFTNTNGPLLSENGIECWPNPVSDRLHIAFNLGTPVDISLFNLEGRLLYKEPSVASRYELRMDSWPASIYFLRFTTPDGKWIQTKKIVKQ